MTPLDQATAIARQARATADTLDAATRTARKAKWERAIQDVREGLADCRRLLRAAPREDRRATDDVSDIIASTIQSLPPGANRELLPDYRKTLALLRQRRNP